MAASPSFSSTQVSSRAARCTRVLTHAAAACIIVGGSVIASRRSININSSSTECARRPRAFAREHCTPACAVSRALRSVFTLTGTATTVLVPRGRPVWSRSYYSPEPVSFFSRVTQTVNWANSKAGTATSANPAALANSGYEERLGAGWLASPPPTFDAVTRALLYAAGNPYRRLVMPPHPAIGLNGPAGRSRGGWRHPVMGS